LTWKEERKQELYKIVLPKDSRLQIWKNILFFQLSINKVRKSIKDLAFDIFIVEIALPF